MNDTRLSSFFKKPLFWFLSVSLFGYIVLFVRLLLSHGEVFGEVFGVSGYFSMSDMLMHLQFVNDPANVYFTSEQACFPPFAYLFYLFINRIIPGSESPDMNFYRSSPIFNLIYIILMVILCCILVELIRHILSDDIKGSFFISILILLSEPFWGSAIERGNSVLIALLLLLSALILKDSRFAILRELALIFIAMAAALKIYPAIFGVLYLIEKRYKEVFRLVGYGIFFVFVPFIFFGGWNGFVQLLSNLTMVNHYESSLYTVSGCFYLIYQKLFHVESIPENIQFIGTLLTIVYFIVAIILAWISDQKWVKLFFLSSLMVIFVPSSYPYTTVYLLIPFLYFIKEADISTVNCVYGALFGLIFTLFALPCEWFVRLFDISLCYGIRYIALYVMIIILTVRTIFSFAPKHNCTNNPPYTS